ncbi:MAG: Ribokinase [Candidatus Angelobacter sp.]|jgi:sugar/nucleoside kinase (ribokinase family)|nr:Ribokinase [Candidatus Angelobacter sp.]
MSILVVGSVAFDGIKTPSGKVDRCLGGSATYFSLAASFFTDVRVVAVVGDDFTAEDEAVMVKRGVDISGLQRAKGKTFFWRGEYGENMNEAKTLSTDLNVFETFNPQIPPQYLDSDYLFLANIDPVLQSSVRKQMSKAQLVGGDTMNYWITGKAAELAETLKGIDVLLINDGEARMLGKTNSLPRAAQKILAHGPRVLVIKHGEYGATAFFKEAGLHPFRAPALPIEEVVDPTGAGDCFAGGFMGYIAGQTELNREVFKRAMFYGGVMGSFAVERFGTQRFSDLSRGEIDARFELFRELSHLD